MKTIFLILSLAILTASCSTQKTCHVKKYHVDKSIKRAQKKPRKY